MTMSPEVVPPLRAIPGYSTDYASDEEAFLWSKVTGVWYRMIARAGNRVTLKTDTGARVQRSRFQLAVLAWPEHKKRLLGMVANAKANAWMKRKQVQAKLAVDPKAYDQAPDFRPPVRAPKAKAVPGGLTYHHLLVRRCVELVGVKATVKKTLINAATINRWLAGGDITPDNFVDIEFFGAKLLAAVHDIDEYDLNDAKFLIAQHKET